jgi:hypothetical protein
MRSLATVFRAAALSKAVLSLNVILISLKHRRSVVQPNLSIIATASIKNLIRGIAVAAAVLCQGAPAKAAFVWDVSFNFSGTLNSPSGPASAIVSGTMVTDCDSCVLKETDITSFAFSWTYSNGVIGATSGTFANVGFGDDALSASAGILSYTGSNIETFTDALDGASQLALGLNGVGSIRLQTANFIDLTGTVTQPFTIGTERVSAVPEPSTWAMLLLGFAALGYIGLRQSRVRAIVA